jgi:proteasome-associated ATPase
MSNLFGRSNRDELASLKNLLRDCQHRLVHQQTIIKQLTSVPMTFAKLIKVQGHPDPEAFEIYDEVVVIDSSHRYYGQVGKIIVSGSEDCSDDYSSSDTVLDNGRVYVVFEDNHEEWFSVGLEGKEQAQVRLTQKEDGTFVTINTNGIACELQGIPDLELQVGDTVKIKSDTKNIVAKSYDLDNGPICQVVAVISDGVEIINKGSKFFVYNPKNLSLEEGDRVVCDRDLFSIVRKLERDNRSRYRVSENFNVTWDDIGGLESAKEDLKNAIELPFKHPELFNYYRCRNSRGILLCGPPGTGKTLLARTCVWSLAQVHGKEVIESAFIFVKGPEILDKWIGNSEAEIRELFERGRRHYRKHGYKAILAIDEADAILPQRGTRHSSDVADTIVPMFLGEMDGIDDQQTEENPIVVLMTNRADILDPAVIRPGRVDCIIKVTRPDQYDSVDVLFIHAKDVPFVDESQRLTWLTIATADLFGKTRVLYKVNEHLFTLGDAVNGAMLANIIEIAKMNALHRDIDKKTKTGITLEDLRFAVNKTYQQQRGINHDFDLRDFAEKLGIQPHNMKIERYFGAN